MVNPEDVPKPRKLRASRKDKVVPVDATLVKALYAGSFKVLSFWLGDHWELSEDETTLLTDPTVKTLSELTPNLGAKINNLSGPLQLAAALVVVVAPRVQGFDPNAELETETGVEYADPRIDGDQGDNFKQPGSDPKAKITPDNEDDIPQTFVSERLANRINTAI